MPKRDSKKRGARCTHIKSLYTTRFQVRLVRKLTLYRLTLTMYKRHARHRLKRGEASVDVPEMSPATSASNLLLLLLLLRVPRQKYGPCWPFTWREDIHLLLLLRVCDTTSLPSTTGRCQTTVPTSGNLVTLAKSPKKHRNEP